MSTARSAQPDEKPRQDLTGRDRLVSNVLFSWGSHFVFIIAGFIMPRMIDQRLGQDLLGMWDFAWSLVSYFALVQMGISSSVSRYVAKYRADGDMTGVDRTVSSACFLLALAGVVVIGLTLSLSLLLPHIFGARLGQNVQEAQWVVCFLGFAVACEVSLSAFSGILTGCHRWELHNIIRSGSYALTVVGMIIALLLGGQLSALAVLYFAGQVFAGIVHVVCAYRVCGTLRVARAYVRRSTIKDVFAYGGKTLIPSLSNLLLNQTTAVLIVAYLGPAALALYARPRSLIRHMQTLVSKMAFVLTPTTSSLQGVGNVAEIRDLVIKSVRYSCYMSLPIISLMVVFGGPIVGLWMGPQYANDWVPAILAAGYLAMMVNLPVMSILAGMNAHGRAGVAQFGASACSVVLTIFAFQYLKCGLVGAAIATTVPLTIVNGAYVPSLACRQIDLTLRQYALKALAGPTAQMLPFLACLALARLLFHARPLAGLAWGGTVGGAFLVVLYWRCVLPSRIKVRMLRFKVATT